MNEDNNKKYSFEVEEEWNELDIIAQRIFLGLYTSLYKSKSKEITICNEKLLDSYNRKYEKSEGRLTVDQFKYRLQKLHDKKYIVKTSVSVKDPSKPRGFKSNRSIKLNSDRFPETFVNPNHLTDVAYMQHVQLVAATARNILSMTPDQLAAFKSMYPVVDLGKS